MAEELLWWHRPGQRVVCIDDDAWGDRNPGKLRLYVAGFCIEKDAIYTIRSAGIRCGMVMLRLAEDRTPGLWVAPRFRPARETSIEQFRSLLSPTPQDHAWFLLELAEILEREQAERAHG